MEKVIYKITNLVNDKFYVGSTTNKRSRFQQHRNLLRKGRHHCTPLQYAWNKYGEDKFKFDVIVSVLPHVSMYEVEDLFLAEHHGKAYCYNVSPTAIGCGVGESHYRYGTKLSAEVREKIGAAQRGVKKNERVFTEEGLAAARASMLKNARTPIPYDLTEVLATFPNEVKARYDFTNATYKNALKPMKGIACPDHGEFQQYAAQFRKGRGCPVCGGAERVKTLKATVKARIYGAVPEVSGEYAGYPRTRAEAKEQGATHYFTGLACVNGHTALRKTAGTCVECVKDETAKAAPKRVEYFKEYNKSEASQAAKKAYYERNRAKVIAAATARNKSVRAAKKVL